MSMHQVLGFPEKHPRWATDANRTLEPAEGRKDEGWPADNKLPARWLNWIQNLFARWTAHTGMTAVANWFKNPDMSTPLFVATSVAGVHRVMTSQDGITWTAQTAAEANNWKSVAYGDGMFVAISAAGVNQVMSSPDGITWTVRVEAEANTWVSVCYGDGQFVAVAEDGTNRAMTSPDGITWAARLAPLYAWNCVTYGGG